VLLPPLPAHHLGEVHGREGRGGGREIPVRVVVVVRAYPGAALAPVHTAVCMRARAPHPCVTPCVVYAKTLAAPACLLASVCACAVYGASPLDSPSVMPAAPPEPPHAAGAGVPEALSKFGSRVSLGFSSLLAEAGQVLKTVVAAPPQQIPVGHHGPGHGLASPGAAGSLLVSPPPPHVRKPTTVLHAGGTGVAGRMAARLDDVLRVLEAEVSLLPEGPGLQTPVQEVMSAAAPAPAWGARSVSEDTPLQDLDLDGLESLISVGSGGAPPSGGGSASQLSPRVADVARLRKCVSDLKTIRDVLLGRLSDEPGGFFS
jgi:hypothetical protein